MGIWQTDTSWRIVPSNTFSLVEEKCGIIFASAPALRQFIAYRRRVGTFYPSKYRQAPNEDFAKMRRRVRLRDILWYRQPKVQDDGRVTDARPMLGRSSTSEAVDQVSKHQSCAEMSPLDVGGKKMSAAFHINKKSSADTGASGSSGSSSRVHLLMHKLGLRGGNSSSSFLRSNEHARNARLDQSADRGQGWPGLASTAAGRSIARRYGAWRPSEEESASITRHEAGDDIDLASSTLEARHDVSVTRDHVSTLPEPETAHIWGTRSTAKAAVDEFPPTPPPK